MNLGQCYKIYFSFHVLNKKYPAEPFRKLMMGLNDVNTNTCHAQKEIPDIHSQWEDNNIGMDITINESIPWHDKDLISLMKSKHHKSLPFIRWMENFCLCHLKWKQISEWSSSNEKKKSLENFSDTFLRLFICFSLENKKIIRAVW